MNKNKIADEIIALAKQKGADMAQCFIIGQISTEIYYEQGKIGLLRTLFNDTVSIKVIKDKKKGVVSQNNFENLEAAVENALEAAKSATPDEAEGICDEPATEIFEMGSETPDKEAMYDGLEKFIADAKRDFPKISFDSITVEHVLITRLYKNSNGVDITEKRGYYAFSPMFMALDGDKTSSFNASDAVFENPEADFMTLGMTHRLLEETERQTDTKTVDGKFTGSLIITPQCMEDILSTVEDNFLSDGVLINNTSLFKESIGKKVAADCVSVYAAPLDDRIIGGYSITSDGYKAENMPLIENGVLKNFVLSRYGAKRTGKQRSKNSGGCYVMTAGDKSLEEIIKSTENGVLLNRFSGGEPGVDGDITGVAKNSFLIKNGKITDALSETMISANLADMLKNITAISEETVCNGGYVLPWVKIDGVTVSGK